MFKSLVTGFAAGLLILASFFCCAVYADSAASLIYAAKEGDLKQVQELLEKKVDVDAKGENGVTALMAAASEGHADVVNLLLEWQADVDAVAEKGATALM